MNNRIKQINNMLRQPKTVNVEVSVTTASGTTETRQFAVRKNKLNKISGTGLGAKQVYDLIKNGETESVDVTGSVYKWKIVAEAPKAVEELQDLATEAE